MKKIALLLVVCCSVLACNTKKEFENADTQPIVQKKPGIPRAYVWDIPSAKNLMFKNLLPQDTYVIPAYGLKGEAMFLLVSGEQFDQIQKWFDDAQKANQNLPINRFVGLDFAVSYIEDLSLVSFDKIKEMPTNEQKNLAEALNPYEKYTLMGQNPKTILGLRENTGKYIPDFSEYTYRPTQPAPQSTAGQSNQQGGTNGTAKGKVSAEYFFSHPKGQ